MNNGLSSTIFWRVHTYWLRGELEKARYFLNMLDDEEAKNPSLANNIRPIHLLRLKEIRMQLNEGLCRLPYSSLSSEAWFSVKAKKSGLEKDFHNKLLSKKGRSILKCLLDAPEDTIIISELNMGEYGRCDIVMRGERKSWVIEVKMGEAPQAVITQINKYRISEELEMNLGFHDEVYPVVMAESFSNLVQKELMKQKVQMMTHAGTIESLKLLRKETLNIEKEKEKDFPQKVFPKEENWIDQIFS